MKITILLIHKRADLSTQSTTLGSKTLNLHRTTPLSRVVHSITIEGLMIEYASPRDIQINLHQVKRREGRGTQIVSSSFEENWAGVQGGASSIVSPIYEVLFDRTEMKHNAAVKQGGAIQLSGDRWMRDDH